jgi:hypothetical protein
MAGLEVGHHRGHGLAVADVEGDGLAADLVGHRCGAVGVAVHDHHDRGAARAKRRQSAAPIPSAPPVTTTTLSFTSIPDLSLPGL